jgi:hypothetical protein
MKYDKYVINFLGNVDFVEENVYACNLKRRLAELTDDGITDIKVFACVPVEYTAKRSETIIEIIE